MKSELLTRFHQEVCPEIPIDSIDFTQKLIEEVTKLKQEIEEAQS